MRVILHVNRLQKLPLDVGHSAYLPEAILAGVDYGLVSKNYTSLRLKIFLRSWFEIIWGGSSEGMGVRVWLRIPIGQCREPH